MKIHPEIADRISGSRSHCWKPFHSVEPYGMVSLPARIWSETYKRMWRLNFDSDPADLQFTLVLQCKLKFAGSESKLSVQYRL